VRNVKEKLKFRSNLLKEDRFIATSVLKITENQEKLLAEDLTAEELQLQEECTRQLAQDAKKKLKFRSNLLKEDRFIAEIAI
jgi:hypothetical protein